MVYRISIVGTGYVGLCTAVGFASRGYKVFASTQDPEKADSINRGVPPFYEPELEHWLKKAVEEGHLRCVVDRREAVLNTDITFIATATPSRTDGSIDLRYVESSAREIGEALGEKETYHLVVVKSTVVPGTTEKLVKRAIERHSGKSCGADFGLCMSPEFLREGKALHDTLNPDRIVIGEYDKRSGDILEALYRDFYCEKTVPTIRTNLPTAELIKYANNACLAARISFINTIANICERIPGLNVETVAKGIGLDKRIGPLFLEAGLGYGGSCLPKDVKALIAFSKGLGYDPALLNAIEGVNETQPDRAVELAKRLAGGLEGRKVAVLGLSFKPDTDDVREAVSTKIINRLLGEKATVVAYDPAAVDNSRKIFGRRVEYASSARECMRGADCCIVVTEWEEFKQLTPEDFIQNMHQPVLIDGRRIYNPEKFIPRLRFAAIGLGQRIIETSST